MAAITTCARRSAPSGLRLGASRDGERISPASIAASAMRHLARGLAEIALRGGVDAIGACAEIDAVEIELENLGLGELALEPERQHQLLQLAREGALLGQEQVLGELLGDGRAALRYAAAAQVGDSGAQQGRSDRCRNGCRSGGPRWRETPSAERAAYPSASAWRRASRRGSRAACRRCRRSRSRAAAAGFRANGSAAGWRRPRRSRRRDDQRPQAEHRAPIEQPAQRRAARARLRAPLMSSAPSAPARDAAAAAYRPPVRGVRLTCVSPWHVPIPAAHPLRPNTSSGTLGPVV